MAGNSNVPVVGIPVPVAVPVIPLNGSAPKIMAEAIKSGTISPQQILRMLPAWATKHQETLEKTAAWLVGFFQSVGVIVVSPEMKERVTKAMAREEKRERPQPSPSSSQPGFLRKLYEQDIHKYERLVREDVAELSHNARHKGDIDARDKLTVHNLRLVMWIADSYNPNMLEDLDLIQEGNIGLMTAAQCFEHARGNTFATYAMYWIRQSITRAKADLSTTVRAPVHTWDFWNKVLATSERLAHNLGRVPEPWEIAERLWVPVEQVESALKQMRITQAVSLDAPVGQDSDDEAGTLLNVFADSFSPRPDEELEKLEQWQVVYDRIRLCVARLDGLKIEGSKAKAIFRMRYGLDGSFDTKTLEQVGERFALTRERIRQVVERTWTYLESTGLKRALTEPTLSEEGYDCILKLQDSGRLDDSPSLLTNPVASVDSAAAYPSVKRSIGEDLLACLKEKERRILVRYFGLDGSVPETLETIGKEFKVTRQRIQQIKTRTVNKIAKSQEARAVLQQLRQDVVEMIEDEGGVILQTYLEQLLLEPTAGLNPGTIYFILSEMLKNVVMEVHQDEAFEASWALRKVSLRSLRRLLTYAEAFISSHNSAVPEDELVSALTMACSSAPRGMLLTGSKLASKLLVVSRVIRPDVLGGWGLTHWPTVTPKTLNDKVYVVLKKHGKPLHFQKIAQLINQAQFDSKVANPKSVLNVMIDDKRYVVVGLGIYALKEWGYAPGTVAEVITEVLKEWGEPMPAEEIIDQVLARRLVKRATVRMNLCDHSRFTYADGCYTLVDKTTDELNAAETQVANN